jgi:hypothetical protein
VLSTMGPVECGVDMGRWSLTTSPILPLLLIFSAQATRACPVVLGEGEKHKILHPTPCLSKAGSSLHGRARAPKRSFQFGHTPSRAPPSIAPLGASRWCQPICLSVLTGQKGSEALSPTSPVRKDGKSLQNSSCDRGRAACYPSRHQDNCCPLQ